MKVLSSLKSVCPILLFSSLIHSGLMIKMSHAAEFKLPYSAKVFAKSIGGEAGARSQFGLGTTQTNFIPFLSNLPNHPSTTEEVFLGEFAANDSLPLAISTDWNSRTYFATIGGNDQASQKAFSDLNNSLGLGGSAFQQTQSNLFYAYLDDAASFLFDDDDNDIVLQLRVQPIPISLIREIPEPSLIYGLGAIAGGTFFRKILRK